MAVEKAIKESVKEAKVMNIYQAISKCMEDIGAVGKNDTNKTQGFKYRGIDAVMNAINPALVKNHIFIVPEVLDRVREERVTAKGAQLIYSICKIKFTFYAEDGSHVEAITVGEGMDSGDKATNKAMAIAFKYACFQVFCIPTEEMTDPDGECHDLAPTVPQKQEIQQPTFNPATADQLHKMSEFVDAYADMCEDTKPEDVWTVLKKKYSFKTTGDISAEMANQITKQVETWYKKKKEADA